MPIALERGGEIERLGFDREIRCSPIYDSPAISGDMKGLRSPPEIKAAAAAAWRGISSFYNGKSKSFASLSDAMLSCSSIKDLGKQENAYTRKRRNLLASTNFHLKSSPHPLKGNGGAISKRAPSNGRSMQALAMAMSNNSSIEEDHKQQYHLLPPLHPPGKTSAAGSSLVRSSSPQYCSFPMRSFSLTDLQAMTNSKS
ncbi:uncharacterized protein A4U43_C07F36440 [Asparagus officinalis]|uniref:Uncharacterized protein n=1 Tax=Asparagus officinalis TaxID=4686 RepID=A0A5P1EHZ9_ASPOF|nr:uncharacterized protein A4U43_C07F36440 [Asparagus officinalis]